MSPLLFILITACSMQTELHELKSVDNRMRDNVFMPVFESVSSEYNQEKSVIVVRITSKDEKYDVRASVLYRDDFKWYLVDKKDKIFGFTEYNDILVLVFGDSGGKFYVQTDIKESFSFLETSDYKKHFEPSEIEIEPDMFEPIVWMYSVSENEFQFIEKGALPLLE